MHIVINYTRKERRLLNLNIDNILNHVPNYTEFYNTDELNEHSVNLASKYPDRVTIKKLGYSKLGKPIYCLKIGNGLKIALAYGTPHPNEPIGSMMLDTLCNLLVSDIHITKELDFTWYIIKSSDIDGLEKNKGWLKGPYTLTNYQHHFFRPAFDQQVEWSFPVSYKNYIFNQPTPETICIMKLIEEIHPDFIYSLHNSGFGGAYWYITDGNDILFSSLKNAAKKQNIPLSLGESETPYSPKFDDAIFQMTGFTERYDYMEKNLPGHNAEVYMSGGACSFEYAKKYNPNVRMLVSEVPYFSNPAVSDTSLSDLKRRDVLIDGYTDYLNDIYYIKPIYQKINHLFSDSNQFYLAVKERIEMSESTQANLKQLKSNNQYNTFATKSQVFDSLHTLKFYSNLSVVLCRRACAEELVTNTTLSPDQIHLLNEAKKMLTERENINLSRMEEDIIYSVIPIPNLVKVQLESGLLYAQYIQNVK